MKRKFGKGGVIVLAVIGAGVVVLAAVLIFAPGSSVVRQIKSGCKATELQLADLPATALTNPITLEAKLMSDNKPVATRPLAFFVTGNGPNGWTGQSIGGADTGADGVAKLQINGGLAVQVPSPYTVTGYRTEFRIPGNGDYCRSSGEATII